jgi:ABC-type lipopolysaccharide export system ATPase subunit
MTPKEKAKELVEKFAVKEFNESRGWFTNGKESKKMAIACVDEIYSFMKMIDEHNKDCHMANTHWVKYWNSVKTEIQSL